MAQKKVILKDGSNDLLPKTLASMVFTEAGQTVEEALQSAGGGGSSSGGGTGNVNVTNASTLSKDAYYAFQPSAAGSLTGEFATIPTATEEKSGLFARYDKKKLDAIKEERELPSSVVSLSSNSTKLEVQKAMYELIGGTWSEIEGNDENSIMLIVALYWGASVMDFSNGNMEKNYIYRSSRISLVPTYTPPASGEGNQYQKASLELTYVSSGRLRTVTLAATLNSSGESATYDFTAEVVESGDDTYYLPFDVALLKAGATAENIEVAFGGEGMFTEAVRAASNKKKLYIYQGTLGLIPVSAFTPFGVLGYFSFLYNSSEMAMLKHVTESKVKEIHPSGYPLKPALYTLTTSSSSDDISTAVGGESGLKEIIQAVKDGNRLVIRGELDDTSGFSADTPLKSVLYQEGENGDLTIAFSYELFAIVSYSTYFIGIQYTKSSNTFAVLNNGSKSSI